MGMNSGVGAGFVVAAILVLAGAPHADAKQQRNETATGADGTIVVPDVAYQRDWTMLGVWAHPGKDAVTRVNMVYTQPESVSVYRRTGEFPPGAILLTELRGGHTTSGGDNPVSSLGSLTSWFVMVKPHPYLVPSGPL